MLRGDRFIPTACDGCGGRARAVPGEGSERPTVFLVGEAPGPQEERQGRPFVGRAGKLLRTSLAVAGWAPGELWITNVVKAFPHALEDGKRRIRRPSAAEVRACLPHLVAEAEALRPGLLLALGRTAAEALLDRRVAPLSDLRGRTLAARPELGGRAVFVTIHPSALQYGRLAGKRAGFVEDLRAARHRLSPQAPGHR